LYKLFIKKINLKKFLFLLQKLKKKKGMSKSELFLKYCKNDNMKLILNLIENSNDEIDYNFNTSEDNGATPLIYGIMNKNIELIKLLIEKKVDVNKSTLNQQTPLHISSMITKSSEIIQLLIDSKKFFLIKKK
jgi:ankyrin repeat protein